MLSKYFIHNSVNHPMRTIVLAILLTLFFISGLRWFVVDDDFLKMFPEGMHSRIVWEDIINEFGDTEFFFIAIGNAEEILNNKTISDISKITNSLNSSSMVYETISLTTIDKIYSDDGWLTIETLIPADKIGSLTPQELKKIDNYLLENPKIRARLISQDGNYTNIAVRPEIKDLEGNNRNNSDLTKEIESIMDAYSDSYEIQYAGNAYVTGAVPELIQNDASRLILIGLLLMVFILYLNLRSVFGVFLIVSTIILSVLSMNGFMGWMYFITGKHIFNFTLINTSMPIILLTIANSDGVHVISRYIKESKIFKSKGEALSETIRALSVPIFLTSITTAIAFLSMIFSPIPHMAGFAVSISFGIMWAWILSLTYLPSMIRIKKWEPIYNIHNNTIISRLVSYISSITLNKPRAIISYSIIIILLSIVGISLIDVEVNVIKFFKEDNKIRKSTEFVDENLIGTMSLVVRAEGDLKNPQNLIYIDSLQQFIDSVPESNLTLSLSDAVKTMNREFNEGDNNYFSIPESKKQISQLLALSNKEQLSSVANTMDYNSGLIHSALISTSTERIVEISDQINGYIASKPIESLSFEISGMMIFVKEFVDLVIKSSITSIVVSIIAVFIISILFLKRLKWGLLAIIPLTIAVFMNFGLMGLFDIKLSHLTALLSAIIIGVGVDFAIHFISEYRSNKKRNVPADSLASETNTNIGYPIILDVFSNMGFAALLFSDIIPLNYIGGLMVLAMLTTSFGTLTVLSTTMHWLRGRI